MPTTLRLRPPEDYLLRRDVCSYGYFLLAPNHWDVRGEVFTRPLRLGGGAVMVRISQRRDAGASLRVECSRTLRAGERAEAQRQIVRMLRLDDESAMLAEFHRTDPRWKRSGRGRLFRSPTMFEDVIKTVTSCNVTWPSTIVMNRRLCEVVGEPASTRERNTLHAEDERTFPTPGALARTRPAMLRARCRTGYRDARIVELARLFSTPPSRGGLDARWFEDPGTPDDAIHERLLELPGIGPYAAANIMQLLGRYRRLPLDTESVRHGRTILKLKGSSAQVMKRVHAHFAPFGAHAFRSYWFELWSFYEGKHGPAWTWRRDSTGKMFTAALLNQ